MADRLQLEGNYHNLGLFLDRVSKFPRIINIGEHRHGRRRIAPTAASSMTIDATATTFVLVDTPPAAPEDSQEGAKKAPAKAPAKK